MTSVAHGAQAPLEPPPLAFQFLDLRAQFRTIEKEVMEAIARVMANQEFILGQEVRLFEEEIAAMLGVRFAVGCASGSDALFLAMMALGVGPGDEVITTPFTFVATAGSIARTGAKPVFVDIDIETFNLDSRKIECAITSSTRAIMPVHLFGLPADLDPILQLANARGLAVIEDAAQALGARYGDRFAGTFGAIGCFSFFPSKNLGAAGDGGLVTTDDAALADKLRLLRVHGSRTKYHHEILGTNSRLDALQAAILRAKFRHLEEWTRARQLRADRYRSLFEHAGLTDWIQIPRTPSFATSHVYNQFSIRCHHRDALRDYLRHRGVPTEVYYPLPLHLQPAFSYLGHRPGEFPMAESASRQILSLPVYPELQEQQQEAVVRAIRDFYSNGNNRTLPQT